MNIHFVVRAPKRVSEDLCVFNGTDPWDAAPFIDRGEADAFAQRQAAATRGVQFWVIEGQPVAAFTSEPVQVVSVPPSVGDS